MLEENQEVEQTESTSLLGAGEQSSDQSDQQETPEAVSGIERPDYIQEQFWDKERGEVRAEALSKSYAEAQSELMKAKQALHDGAPKGLDKAEDYQLGELPEGVEITEDDALLAGFREFAHGEKLSQEQFQKAVNWFHKFAAANGVEPEPAMTEEQVAAAQEAEVAKLGENGKEILSAVEGWGEGLMSGNELTDGEYSALFDPNIPKGGAEYVSALNKLRMKTGEQPIKPTYGENFSGAKSKEEVAQMYHDPRYRTDPAFRKEVERHQAMVSGTAPASTSR